MIKVVLPQKKDVHLFLLLFSVLIDCYETSVHFEFSLLDVIFLLSVEVMEKKCLLCQS